jgi:L-lactate utilization protein LutB
MQDSLTMSPDQEESGQLDDAKGQAQEKAQQFKHKAGEQMRRQVDQRSTQVGERVAGQASDIRSVADELRQKGKEQPAKMAEQAAERADRLGSYLTDNGADRILADVEDQARRKPWAVVAGGVVLGLAASRLLKASSRERYQTSMAGSP